MPTGSNMCSVKKLLPIFLWSGRAAVGLGFIPSTDQILTNVLIMVKNNNALLLVIIILILIVYLINTVVKKQ